MEGIPTVLITVDPEQSWQARPSRALNPVGFKLGNSLGNPGATELQKTVLTDALDVLLHPPEPGTIVKREYPAYVLP
jgi:hypothetical protein